MLQKLASNSVREKPTFVRETDGRVGLFNQPFSHQAVNRFSDEIGEVKSRFLMKCFFCDAVVGSQAEDEQLAGEGFGIELLDVANR